MRCRAAGEDFPAPNGGVDVFGIEFEGKGFASGSTKRVSKRRAMIKRQAERALQGDTRAFSCLVAMSPEENAADRVELPSDLEPGDRALIERFLSKQAGSPERGK